MPGSPVATDGMCISTATGVDGAFLFPTGDPFESCSAVWIPSSAQVEASILFPEFIPGQMSEMIVWIATLWTVAWVWKTIRRTSSARDD